MALTFFWRCESATLSGTDDLPGADTVAAPNSGVAINSDRVKVGTNSMDCPTGNDYYLLENNTPDMVLHATPYEMANGFWIYVNTWLAGAQLQNYVNQTTANNYMQFRLIGASGSGGIELNLRVQGGGNYTLNTGDKGLATGNWYFFQWDIDTANTTARLRVFNSSRVIIGSATVDTAVPANAFTDSGTAGEEMDRCYFGEGGGGTVDLHIDNIFIANAYDEDLIGNANITSYTEYGGVVSIDTFDTPILDGEQNNAFTVLNTTGNVNEVLLGSVEGVNSIDVTASLTGSGLGPYTYDNDDVSAFTVDTAGLAFNSASWTNYLQAATTVDGSFQATIVINPAAGYKVIEALNPLKDAGHVYEDFVGIPVSTDQVLYESTNNTNNTLSDYFEIEADGTILTNITSGTIHCVYWDSAVTTWKPFDIIISSAGLFVTGSLSLLGVGG